MTEMSKEETEFWESDITASETFPPYPRPNVNWVHKYYNELGLCIIPIQKQSKSPARGVKWSKYQSTRPTKKEIGGWVDKYLFKNKL